MSFVLAAIDRSDIADYVDKLFYVFTIIILIRVLLSWVPRLPYNRVLHALVTFVHDVADPYLRLFRRVIPPIGGGGVGIDISPIVAIFVLVIAQNIIVSLIRG
jgi:YggT family protein